jgi:6-phosphogluconolactonase (cycloisomerase 2 family)
LLAATIIGCTSIPTCNDEGNGGGAGRRAAAVGCPSNNGGGGGGGGGGNSCNSQLAPAVALFGLTSTGTFEEWEIATTGDLFLTCNTGTAALGQTVTAAGKYVYVLDITKPQIFEFSMSTGGKGALTAVTGQPFQFPSGSSFGATDVMVADPLGRFLIVTSVASNSVHVLLISASGALSEAQNSPVPVPHPAMAAIDPNGGFVFFADTIDGDILTSMIDANGQITPGFAVQSASAPIWLAVHQSGSFLFSAENSNVEAYSINQGTGALTLVGLPVDISSFGAASKMLAIDSTGSFLYLLFQGNIGILGFSINTGNGAISQLQNTVFNGSNATTISQILADPSQSNLFSVAGGGIFNITINSTNGNLTVPSLTIVAGSTPTTSGAISISNVP